MEEKKGQDLQSLGDLFAVKKEDLSKPPAYQWQDLALRVTKELAIPLFKKSAVFKVCRDNSKEFIETCLNDTKELCQSGERWKYFFKTIENRLKEKDK
jgi:hypothetical protein